jgi:hypothetical protein
MSSEDGETVCNSLRPRRIFKKLNTNGGGRGNDRRNKPREKDRKRGKDGTPGNWLGRRGKGEYKKIMETKGKTNRVVGVIKTRRKKRNDKRR